MFWVWLESWHFDAKCGDVILDHKENFTIHKMGKLCLKPDIYSLNQGSKIGQVSTITAVLFDGCITYLLKGTNTACQSDPDSRLHRAKISTLTSWVLCWSTQVPHFSTHMDRSSCDCTIKALVRHYYFIPPIIKGSYTCHTVYDLVYYSIHSML